MNLEKEVFTTFEVAKICNANITSIKNWIEQGEISAFRTPGGHYRIERHVLNDFLTRHHMPNPLIQAETRRILLVHPDAQEVLTLQEALSAEYECRTTTDVLDALLYLGQWEPHAAIIDERAADLDVTKICECVRANPQIKGVKLIIVLQSDDPDLVKNIEASGANRVIRAQKSRSATIECVREVMGPS